MRRLFEIGPGRLLSSRSLSSRSLSSRLLSISACFSLFIIVWAQGAMAEDSIERWSPVPGTLPTEFTQWIAAPETSSVSYVVTTIGRLFRSDDGGATWREPGKAPFGIRYLACDLRQPDRLYAIARPNVPYRSEDGGQTWELIEGLSDQPVYRVLVTPTNPPTVLFRGGRDYLRSIDGGDTWSERDLPEEGGLTTSIEYHPKDPQVLWQRSSVALHRSDDAGDSWSRSHLLGFHDVLGFAVHPNDTNRAFASDGTTLFRTNNQGLSWDIVGPLPLRDPPSEGRFHNLVSAGGGVLLLSQSPNLLWRSRDGGLTWDALPWQGEYLRELRWIPEASQLTALVSYTGSSGLVVSDDLGQTWGPVGDSIQGGTAVRVVWTGAESTELLVGLDPQRVARSVDRGRTWQIETPPLADPSFLGRYAVDPHDPERVLVSGVNDEPLAFSTDSGRTWTHSETDFSIQHPVFDPRVMGRVLALSGSGDVLVSEDSGTQWSLLWQNTDGRLFLEIAVDPFDSQHLILSSWEGAIRSRDGGQTWGPLEVPTEAIQLSFYFDKIQPERLYLLAERDRLYRSTNAGATWAEFSNFPRGGLVQEFIQEPGGTLWAALGLISPGTDFGPYRSLDAGQTWEIVTLGLESIPSFQIKPLALAANPQGELAMGTSGHGVYLLESCVQGPTTACLLGGRFRVEGTMVSFDDPPVEVTARVMEFPSARAESDQAVFFESFQEGNFEVGVKMVDGCGLPDGHPAKAFWAFFGGLTNAGTTIRIEDRMGDGVYVWNNPAGDFALTQGDTQAFPCAATEPPPSGPCEAGDGVACLLGGRFHVSGTMQSFDDPPVPTPVRVMQFAAGRAESARAVFFESFQEGNFEVGVKMVDACGLPDDHPLRAYWAFYGGLTNAETRIDITQFSTGAVDTWTNAAGAFPRSEGRTSAFACDP